MDPYFQQRLRDEVTYLHSLWYQGPPTSSNSNTNPSPRFNNPIPNPSNPNLNSSNNRPGPRRNGRNPSQPDPPQHSNPQFSHQGPSSNPNNSTNRKRIRKARNERHQPNKKPSQPNSNSPWPCPSPANDSTAGTYSPWPSKPNSAPAAHPSPEEKARHAALKLQQMALDSCRGLFSGYARSDREESEESESEGGDDYWVENGESKVYKALLNVFVEKSELRSYYEVNYEKGEFYCLVCGGLGKNKWMKGCNGLVHHSISIANTKMKRAHRDFARVVCSVLGWDFDRLPTIMLKGERLGLSLVKPGKEQGEHEVSAGSNEGLSVSVQDNVAAGNAVNENLVGENAAEDILEDENVVEDNVAAGNAVEDNVAPENAADDSMAAENDTNAELDENVPFDDDQYKVKEEMICENSLKDDGTNKITESIDKGMSETEENKAVDTQGIDQSLISRTEWPCKETSVAPLTDSGWPTFSSHSVAATCSIPVEEQARSAALLLQQKAIKECQDFFAGNNGSNSDEDNSENEDEGDLMDEDGSEENALKLFSKIFTEDGELRSFYMKNCEGGEFYCLVCAGLRKKAWKRFKGCVALLQHSTAILKTKKKVAHRVYGQVICKVVGWDIGRPLIIGSTDKPLEDGPLAESYNLQGELEEKADDCKDNVVPKEKMDSLSDHTGEIVSDDECDAAQANRTSETCDFRGELEGNADYQKDNVVSKENLDSMSGHDGEIVSKEEIGVVQSNGTSKTCELQGDLEENVDNHQDIVVASIQSFEAKSGHSGEVVSKEESDVDKINEAPKTNELQAELEDNADDCKDNVVSKESLDSMSNPNSEIVSKEESDGVQSSGASKTIELQGEIEKAVDGPNEDLNVFMENLGPLSTVII